MASSDSWRTVIIIFAVFILIGGAIGLISSFVGAAAATSVYDYVLRAGSGGLYCAIGIFGIIAGATKKKPLAAIYFFGLLFVIVLIIIGYVLAIIFVTKLVQESCDVATDETCDIDGVKKLITIIFVVLLAINVACCGAYALCAGLYWRSLVRDE